MGEVYEPVEGASHLKAKVYVSSYSNYDVLAHLPHGTESEGIYGFHFTPESAELTPMATTGKSALLDASCGPNPAFMKVYEDRLYVVNERIDTEGSLSVYQIDEKTGAIALQSQVNAAGRSTCYIHLDASEKWILLINYWDATLSVVEHMPNGQMGKVVDVHRRPGFDYCKNENPDRAEHLAHRQGWSHAHCVVPGPRLDANDRFGLYFVPDLGEECIHQFVLDRETGALSYTGRLRLKAGHGPRHMVFHPCGEFGFVVNELDSTVDLLRYDLEKAQQLVSSFDASSKSDWSDSDEMHCLSVVQTISTLPEGFKGKSHCAEIKVGPDGRFLYVANRFSDTIAVFRIDSENGGQLSCVEIVSSQGKTPRHFSFDPSGNFMVVANTDNDTLCVFAIHPLNGSLSYTGKSLKTPSPNYVLIVPECEPTAVPDLRMAQ
uniref:6-phosphogluconolactonase n=1 Tax=Timspurckia oligopyrenoides TaxID=708627 RepID=A0A7S0ZJ75_9RHOD|mmetsp:Transcript_7421/g.13395  ORF Transcript_7421/g.13395 Transcript_7421/m.13395 type:complete len:434 (+) Transcript_7421:1796-3097(+)